MKSHSSALLDAWRRPVVNVAWCWRIISRDGSKQFFYTSHDIPIVIEGSTYIPTNSFRASSIEGSTDFSVDNLEILAIKNDEITEVDLLSGVYDEASVEFFIVDNTNVAAGIIPIRKGFIGEIRVENEQFKAELRGYKQRLTQEVLEIYTLECRTELGSTLCGVRLDPPVWTPGAAVTEVEDGDAKLGSIVKPTVYNGFYFTSNAAGTTGGSEPSWPSGVDSTVNDNGITWTAIRAHIIQGAITTWYDRVRFIDINITDEDNWFQYGIVKMTSGANVGVSKEVIEYKADGQFVLLEPFYHDLDIGDTFEATVGCNKIFDEACRDKFNNILNHRGFPFIPGPGRVYSTPEDL